MLGADSRPQGITSLSLIVGPPSLQSSFNLALIVGPKTYWLELIVGPKIPIYHDDPAKIGAG